VILKTAKQAKNLQIFRKMHFRKMHSENASQATHGTAASVQGTAPQKNLSCLFENLRFERRGDFLSDSPVPTLEQINGYEKETNRLRRVPIHGCRSAQGVEV